MKINLMMRWILAPTIAIGIAGPANAAFRRNTPFIALSQRADTPTDQAAFNSWLGKPSDLVMAFAVTGQSTSTWDQDVALVTAQDTTFAGQPLDWAIPLATSTQNLAATTAGTYDSQINAMLATILAHQSGTIYLRVGWEAGYFTAWPWSATTSAGPSGYIAAFNHVGALIRAASSRIKIVWCVSAYASDYNGAAADPATYYPGDTYVDVVGIDLYLTGNDSTTLARTFASYRNSASFPYGIDYITAFAGAHSKSLAVPEWGACGAERPDYVRDMAVWLKAHSVLYAGYWNKNNTGFNCKQSDGQYPIAAAAFIDLFNGSGTGFTEDSDTSQVVARMTTAPSTARRALIDTLIKALKVPTSTAVPSAWSQMNGLYVLAASTSQAAIINWKNGDTVPTITGTTTFTADRGFQTDGSTGFVSTAYNPTSVSGTLFTQNDASMGVWSLTDVLNGGATTNDVGSSASYIGRNTGGNIQIKPNTSSSLTGVTPSSFPGYAAWTRTYSNIWNSYGAGGAPASNSSTASTTLNNNNLTIGKAAGASFGANQIAIFYFGGSLDAATEVSVYNAFYSYLHSILAI